MKCKIFGHRYELVKVVNHNTKLLRCQRCPCKFSHDLDADKIEKITPAKVEELNKIAEDYACRF